MKTAIKNVIIITMNDSKDIFKDGVLIFDGDKITDIGNEKDISYPKDCEIIDGKGAILMPGMINLHSHLGMIPFRGLQDDCIDRFRRFLLPMEKSKITPQLVYLSTKYAISEMLLSGITTVMDMYYFEKEAARAADEMSIRGFMGQTIMDQEVCDFSNPEESLCYADDMIKNYKAHPLITACIAPHGTSTCSEATLKMAYELSQKHQTPITIHVAEMEYEMRYFENRYHMTPIQFLDSLEIIDQRMIAGHCISMQNEDFTILRTRNASVAHCIGSNTKAAKGVAPVKDMLEAGITVGLGTDGPSSGNTLDLFTQFKLFANFHKNQNRDRSLFPADSIVELGTKKGAEALHIADFTGSLEVGKQADLVLVETDSVNMFPIYNPYSTLVYSANSSNVHTVYVAGKCVVRNKRLVGHDLVEIKKELLEEMKRGGKGGFGEQLYD